MRAQLLEAALGMAEAYEDHPWGETVVKVRKKVFVFLGLEDSHHPPSLTLKLPESGPGALGAAGAAPTGYGLGRAGWVTLQLEEVDVPVEVLLDWLEESYRAVAPKRLSAQLDG